MASESKQPEPPEPPADLPTRFFGVDPREWLDDVYNVQDDLMNDGVDAFERELRRLVRLGDGPGKADKRAAAGAVAHDAALAEEIAKGADSLAKDLADSHEVPGDKLYLYALRNVFAIGAQLQDAVEAELAPRPKPSRLYTAAEEAAVDARIESAEAALLSERRRRRALRHVKALLEKRLPEAEAAAAALADVADQFAASGVTAGSVEAFSEQAGRLDALCDRLATAAATPLPLGAAMATAHGGGGGGGDALHRVTVATAAAESVASSATTTGAAGGGSASAAVLGSPAILAQYVRDANAMLPGGGGGLGAALDAAVSGGGGGAPPLPNR